MVPGRHDVDTTETNSVRLVSPLAAWFLLIVVLQLCSVYLQI